MVYRESSPVDGSNERHLALSNEWLRRRNTLLTELLMIAVIAIFFLGHRSENFDKVLRVNQQLRQQLVTLRDSEDVGERLRTAREMDRVMYDAHITRLEQERVQTVTMNDDLREFLACTIYLRTDLRASDALRRCQRNYFNTRHQHDPLLSH